MILLDTHVWVWFLSNPELLSKKSKKRIDIAIGNHPIFVSSISVWEVALLVKRKRLVLNMGLNDWLKKAESLPFFSFLPVDNEIALKSVQLPPPLHNDPADRIIIASAQKVGAPIITKDEKILNYPKIKTIW